MKLCAIQTAAICTCRYLPAYLEQVQGNKEARHLGLALGLFLHVQALRLPDTDHSHELTRSQ